MASTGVERSDLVDIEDFWRADPKRKPEGYKDFGFDWRDPAMGDADEFCEVRWYRGTHEIVAVYTTYDPHAMGTAVRSGRVARSVGAGLSLATAAGPVVGPVAGQTASAAAIAGFLADRDLAATRVRVRVLGKLEHPLERYWVLRDALHLESQPDGLAVLADRIAGLAGEEKVALHPADQPSRTAARLRPDPG